MKPTMVTHFSILNHPPRHLEGPQLLHQLIRWKDYPADCAIDCTSGEKRTKYTYKELQSSVCKLVIKIQHELCESKPSSDETPKQHIVPILLPQCPGLYISQLAILSSGGAFCPIVLDSPQERVKFIVGDVEAKLIITTSAFVGVDANMALKGMTHAHCHLFQGITWYSQFHQASLKTCADSRSLSRARRAGQVR